MRKLLVSSLAAALVAGCGPAYYVDIPDEPVLAPSPPPDDIPESPGPAPWSGATWRPGYWYWTGDEWVWVDGEWSRPPALGFVWVNAGWIFVDGLFRFMPGRWAHPHHVPHYPYYRPGPQRPHPTPHPTPHPAPHH